MNFLYKHRIGIMLALWVVAFIFALWGMVDYRPGEGKLDIFYRTLSLVAFAFEYVTDKGAIKVLPWQLDIGRIAMGLLTLSSAALALAQIFFPKLRLKIFRPEALICGLGRKGITIARQHIKENRKVTIIEINPTVDEIESFREEKGVVIVIGNAADRAILAACHAERASNVYALCGGGADNLDIAHHLADLRKKSSSFQEVKCIVHLPDETLYQTLNDWSSELEDSNLNIRFYNYIETGARQLLHDHPPHKHNKKLLEKGREAPNVLIIGFGQLGRKLTEQIIHLCHYPSLAKPKLTIIDKQATEKEKAFRAVYLYLDKVCDITFKSQDVREIVPTLTSDINVVYISLGDDLLSNAVALRLRDQELTQPDSSNRPQSPTIIACVSRNIKLISSRDPSRDLNSVQFYELPAHACSLSIVDDESIDEIAKSLFADYYKRKNPESKDSSEHLWRIKASADDRKSNRWAADHFRIKREIINVLQNEEKPLTSDMVKETLEDEDSRDLLAAIEHHRWMATRFMAGWKFAKERDNKNKLHPGLKPWADEDLTSDYKTETRNEMDHLPEILKGLNKHKDS